MGGSARGDFLRYFSLLLLLLKKRTRWCSKCKENNLKSGRNGSRVSEANVEDRHLHSLPLLATVLKRSSSQQTALGEGSTVSLTSLWLTEVG